MAKAIYTDEKHVRDRLRQQLKRLVKGLDSLYPKGRNPWGYKIRGKSTAFIREQINRVKAEYRKPSIIRTASGRLFDRNREGAYYSYLLRCMNGAKHYATASNQPIYDEVIRILSNMSMDRFSDLHDWIDNRGLMQCLFPQTYGYFDSNNVFYPADIDQAGHFINVLYLALREYMQTKNYRKNTLKRYNKAQIQSLYIKEHPEEVEDDIPEDDWSDDWEE